MKVLSLFISFFVVSGVIGFLPSLSPLYIVSLPIAFFYCLLNTRKSLSINSLMLWLILACIFSIVVGKPLSLFRSWERLALFILVVSVISPLFNNDSFFKLRQYLFVNLIWSSILITVISFIGFFFGINYMRTGSYFGGITSHSMTLAPIASISFISSLVISYRAKKVRLCYFYIFLSVISLLCILLSASRSALMGALCSALLIIIFENRRSLRKLLSSLGILIFIVLISFPLWRPYASDLMKKQDSNVEMGGSGFYSREKKWQAREYEFKKSPIFGVGFAAIDISTGDFYKPENGQIEPGTSWGAILAMVGIFGFLPVFFLFLVNFYYMLQKSSSNYIALILAALLLFYSIHLIAEGYIFGSGGFLFFTLWLTLGISTDFRKNNF